MSTAEFDTELVTHRHAVRLCVPPEVSRALGTARLLPAIVTINDHAVPTTLHKMADGYIMAVNKNVQQRVSAGAGDTVHVIVAPGVDTAVMLPDDLEAELTAAGRRAAFDGLTRFRQNEVIKSVTSAKKPETRARRIEAALRKLA